MTSTEVRDILDCKLPVEEARFLAAPHPDAAVYKGVEVPFDDTVVRAAGALIGLAGKYELAMESVRFEPPLLGDISDSPDHAVALQALQSVVDCTNDISNWSGAN